MAAELVRFSKGRVCPVCGGSEDDPRGQGTRCHGYLSDGWVHCSREEHAGKAKFHDASNTWAHRATGKCPCGVEHAPDPTERGMGKSRRKRDDTRIDYDRPVACYDYPLADGSKHIQVRRLNVLDRSGRVIDKTFRQFHWDGSEWKAGIKGVEAVLYRLPELLAADPSKPVVLVEGEKDADRLRLMGIIATTNPMGAGKFHQIKDLSALKGREIVTIADNDAPCKRFPAGEGQQHMARVRKALVGIAGKIRDVGTMPSVKEKGDVSDWLDAGGKLDQLLTILNEAPEWVPPAEKPEGKAKAKEEPKEVAKEFLSHVDILLRIGAKAELFRTPDGDAYASIQANDRTEHHPVASDAFGDWLTVQFMAENGDRAPSADSLKTALATLKARARFSRTERTVGLRVAADPAALDPSHPVYYLDLANEAGQAVKISASGWTIVNETPVKFRRPRGMRPLPVPVRGGNIEILRNYANVEPNDWILLLAVMTHDFFPANSQPVKVLTGEQGSAKSTTTKVMKCCIDPRHPMLGSPPQDVRDLVIIAQNTWLMAFDNVSWIRPWMSDMLCRLATGGGFETRTLHTDAELTSFEACRPIVLNGIDDMVSRQDLLSRSVILNCPTLSDKNRRSEDELWNSFHKDHPLILGALLDLVVGGLLRLPTLESISLPRMATFARWGEAVSRCLGRKPGDFVETFIGNQQSASAELLDDSPLVAELRSLGREAKVLFYKTKGKFLDTAQELLNLLNDRAMAANRSDPKWPRGARSLSIQLRRLAPGLRRCGINIVFAQRLNHSRLIAISWTKTEPAPVPDEDFLASLEASLSDGDIGDDGSRLTQTNGFRGVKP